MAFQKLDQYLIYQNLLLIFLNLLMNTVVLCCPMIKDDSRHCRMKFFSHCSKIFESFSRHIHNSDIFCEVSKMDLLLFSSFLQALRRVEIQNLSCSSMDSNNEVPPMINCQTLLLFCILK